MYLVRPDLTTEDLIFTGKNILLQAISNFFNFREKKKRILETIIELLSKSYFEFRKVQEDLFDHKNFHTLRDFYWMIKIFADLSKDQEEHKVIDLALQAIDINFSGIYVRESNPKTVRSNTRLKHIFYCFHKSLRIDSILEKRICINKSPMS